MTDAELEQLARKWIAWQHAWDTKEPDEEAQVSDGSYDAVCQMLETDPENSWKLMLLIHQLDQSECISQILSAGPFEEFMELYGPSFIERIEAQVKIDPSFGQIVSGFYITRIGDDVSKRLAAISDSCSDERLRRRAVKRKLVGTVSRKRKRRTL